MEMTNQHVAERKRVLREQYLFLKRIEEEEADTSTIIIIVPLAIHAEGADEATKR